MRRRRHIALSSLAFLLVASMITTTFTFDPPVVKAADHRDSTMNDARPEGDMPDVFAHLNPNDPTKLVLSVDVNPFSNPSELQSYRFAGDYLYQIKIDNNGDYVPDFTLQLTVETGAQQPYKMRFGRANNPRTSRLSPVEDTIINVEPICEALVYHGAVNEDNLPAGVPTPLPEVGTVPEPGASPVPTPNTEPNGGRSPVIGRDGTRCFVGIRDDPFVTDVAQATFRIALNPNPTRNFRNHEQDIFRNFRNESNPFGDNRGRPLDELDGPNSGLDGFGGFNVSVMAAEIPVAWVLPGQTGNPGMGPAPVDVLDVDGDGDRTEGFVDTFDVDGDGNTTETVANTVPACPKCINVWATTSIAKSDNGNERIVAKQGAPGNESTVFQQFERDGNQLTNTVWIWSQPPTNTPDQFPALTDGAIKNFFNQLGPEHDVENFAYLIPDALVANVAASAGNNIQLRRSVLASGGFLSPPNGVPYFLDQLAPPFDAIRNANIDKRLVQRLVLPDVLRLDLGRASSVSPALPGAAASGNGGNDLGALQFGLQNGRRTADDATDIILRLGRELADVSYTPAEELDPARHALRCRSAMFPATPPSTCSDARVSAVLQGTDFIEPDGLPNTSLASISLPIFGAINDVATSGNDRFLNRGFPFFASQHPTPGELNENTTGFPRASDPAIIVFGGVPNDGPGDR
ncbi:MAG: DUF4331 family protein [Pyrinomonadaceae bacterium]